jgi:hypothetical protein
MIEMGCALFLPIIRHSAAPNASHMSRNDHIQLKFLLELFYRVEKYRLNCAGFESLKLASRVVKELFENVLRPIMTPNV